jgi:hypothetical protein
VSAVARIARDSAINGGSGRGRQMSESETRRWTIETWNLAKDSGVEATTGHGRLLGRSGNGSSSDARTVTVSR